MTRATEGSRRRAPRLKTRIAGALLGRASRDVEVVDLSLTGCLVRCGAPFDSGAILDLRLGLDPDPVTAKVRVTSASMDGSAIEDTSPQYLVGLEFMGLPAQGATRLRRYLDEERRRARRPAEA